MSSTPDAAARRAFEAQVAPLRPELLAHCYRMTGARSDAEDALQDALVRAWRAIDGFEARASMRTWLYRVTTNACLDLIADRRARTFPETGPAGRPGDPVPAPDLEARWLEPYPDAMLGAPEHGPDVRLGIVHRDVSPSNLFVTTEGIVRRGRRASAQVLRAALSFTAASERAPRVAPRR